MKRACVVLLALAVLAGCAPAAPVPTPEPTPEMQISEPGRVYADWSKLHAYEPPAETGTRLSPGPLTEFEPSDAYGLLIPYVGEFTYTNDGLARQYCRYGLVTGDGCVVLDPVLDSVRLMTTERGSAYLIQRRDMSGSGKYALCALDGSWCTGFDYALAGTNRDGYVYMFDRSWTDADRGAGELPRGHIMDLDGTVVLDTGDVRPDERIDGSWDAFDLIALASNAAGNVTAVDLNNGACAFMRMDGSILNAGNDGGEFSDTTYQFSGGTVFVQDIQTKLWGIIDTDGAWMREPQYTDVSKQSESTYKAEKADGSFVLVNGHGAETEIVSYESGLSYELLKNGYVSIDCNTEPAVYRDSGGAELPVVQAVLSGDGSGTALMTGVDGRCYSYDGETLAPIDGIPAGNAFSLQCGMIAAEYDGMVCLYTPDGDLLASAHGFSGGVVKDAVTGEIYLITYTENDGSIITAMNGDSLFAGSYVEGVVGGFVNVVDAASSSVMNINGTCVFRTRLDAGD